MIRIYRKTNNKSKGFMMAEVIVTATVVATTLVGIFLSLNRILVHYEKREGYDHVDAIYAAKGLSEVYDFEASYEIENNKYKEISLESTEEVKKYINEYKIEKGYIIKSNVASFNEIVSNNVVNDENFHDYIKYLSQNIEFNSNEANNNILVLKLKKDNSNIVYGYYKIPTRASSTTISGTYIENGGTTPEACNGIKRETNYIEEPELAEGMIPVCFTGSKWKVANVNEPKNTSCPWYDYEENIWANVILVSSTNRSSYVDSLNEGGGKDILGSDVLAMFVWIPRFSYTIACSNSSKCYGINRGGGSTASASNNQDYELYSANNQNGGLVSGGIGVIDVKFVKKEMKENGSANYIYNSDSGSPSNWLTHPAFTWGNDEFGYEELSGLWIGKYSNSSYSDSIKIVPGNNMISSKDPYKLYKKSKNFINSSTYGIEKTYNVTKTDENNLKISLTNRVNSHMIKNSEWSAIAYLFQSSYGKFGFTDDCISKYSSYHNNFKEVYYYYTMSSYGLSVHTTPYATDVDQNYTNPCSGVQVVQLGQVVCVDNGLNNIVSTTNPHPSGIPIFSTTGNKSGVYDLAGGALDAVMGVQLNSENKIDYSNTFFPTDYFNYNDNILYIDQYNTISSTKNSSDKGHALGEIIGDNNYPWFTSYSSFGKTTTSSSSFFGRGGIGTSNTMYSIYSMEYIGPKTDGYVSTRTVITIHNS